MRYAANFILGFLLVTSSLCSYEDGINWSDSPIYRRYIQQISYQPSGSDTIGIIECSDNTQWKFIATLDNELELYKLQKSLKIYSEVFLETNENDPSYWVGNKAKFRVYMCKESLSFLPTIIEKDYIKLSEPGWFTPGERKYLLTLSDGSLWELSYNIYWPTILYLWTPLCLWELGDHILVGRTACNEYYQQLINVEAPHSHYIFESSPPRDLREINHYGFKIKMLNPPS